MIKIDKAEAETKQTTVEEGTKFKGTLHSTCQVVVRGLVEGDLTAPSVIVSETGTVVGNVKAECIRSEGVLAGRVDADDVYLSGSVRSDTVIRAKTLEVKLQRTTDKLQVTFGECILDVGDDPSAELPDAAQAQDASSKPSGERRRSVFPAAEAADKSNEANKRNGLPDDGEESSTHHRSAPPPPS
jgi:cytoskeletal protein CcmA (bactofilin family)